jgi:ATP-binding cassette subfamily C protein
MEISLNDITAGGASVEVTASHPLLLNEPGQLWIVTGGVVELFAVRLRGGYPEGQRRHLFTALAGDALFGIAGEAVNGGTALLAVGVIGSKLVKISRDRLTGSRAESAATYSAGKLLDGWVKNLLSAAQGRVAAPPELSTPVASLAEESTWRSLDTFHAQICQSIRLSVEEEISAEADRLQRRAEQDEREMAGSLRAFVAPAETWGDIHSDTLADPLLGACRIVGKALGIYVKYPSSSTMERRLNDPLSAMARASGIRIRKLALKGVWWRKNNGPILAFLKEGNRPVALLQSKPASYQLHDPTAVTTAEVDDVTAATLQPFGFMLYRPFPEGPIGALSLLKFAAFGNLRDFSMVILMGIAGGMLGLVLPLLTSVLFDGIIPMAQTGQMVQVGLALLVSAIAGSLFSMTEAIALQRIEGTADASLQAAIMDRLLTLPTALFRKYSVGDLTNRVLGINSIREILTGTVTKTVLASVFSTFNLLLLFYYSSSLAATAVGLVILVVIVLSLFMAIDIRYQRELIARTGRLSSLVFQFISGIAKLKVAGAETRGYARWLHEFRLQSFCRRKTGLLGGHMGTFNAVYPVLFTMAIFALFHFRDRTLSTGEFLSFTAAFGQFLAAAVGLSTSLISVIPVLPVYERAKPILQALPELDNWKTDPGDLTGNIEIGGVCFRYAKDGPFILNEISLQVGRGEFIAIVGTSGSGKSTLLRLLLGFETPEAGSIYYDNQNIETVDLQALRRQIGVVLQSGQLMAGDIYSNIVGSNNLSHEEAWEAARLAGLDKDIEAMPMGMFTVIPPGGSTISGGQRQRLLIARAMVTKPGIFFLDEATSALDNITQAIVSSSLESFKATRLVIAHRLSTIIKADRIVVMDKGRIVETGTYDELMAREGLFAELTRRQLL